MSDNPAERKYTPPKVMLLLGQLEEIFQADNASLRERISELQKQNADYEQLELKAHHEIQELKAQLQAAQDEIARLKCES